MTEPMTTVHLTKGDGCPIDGRKDKHQHTWAEWDEKIHGNKREGKD